MKNPQDLLARAAKTLLLREPFYGIFLISTNKIFTEDCETARIGIRDNTVNLEINPSFFESLSKNHRVGLLKHEILHLCLGHLELYGSKQNQKALNIAMDLVINQMIHKDFLPEDGVTIDQFKEFGLAPNQSTLDYYNFLKNIYAEFKPFTLNSEEDSVNNSNEDSEGNGEGSNKLVIKEGSDHSKWKDLNEINEFERRILSKAIADKMIQVEDEVRRSSGPGNIPGELKDILKKIRKRKKPVINWKRYLKTFIGRSIYSRNKYTFRKPNLRFEDFAGIKRTPKSYILIGLDVSASVSNKELEEFLGEMRHIQKTGSQVDVAQFDTELKGVIPLKKLENFKILGRGGTYFQPVVDYFNQSRKYNSLVIFTDGEAGAPENAPRNILWVHTSYSRINEDLPGFKVKMNKEDEAES